MVPLLPALAVGAAGAEWGWTYGGFDSFPSWWGPAGKKSGPESPGYLPLITRHQVAGWGWQQGVDGSCYAGGDEQCQLASLSQLRNYSAAAPGRSFPQAVYVYRNIDAAGREFTELHAALDHHPEWFVSNAEGRPCYVRGNQNAGGGAPNWNLSVPAAVDYMVDVVIGEAAREPGVQGVFLDGADGTDCDSTWKFVQGWQRAFSNCTNATGGVLAMSKADRYAQAQGRLEVLRRGIALLAAHNKTAIVNTARLFEPPGSSKGCTGTGTGLDCSW